MDSQEEFLRQLVERITVLEALFLEKAEKEDLSTLEKRVDTIEEELATKEDKEVPMVPIDDLEPQFPCWEWALKAILRKSA